MDFQSLWNSFLSFIPQLVLGIILILVAWIVAAIVKKVISKGLQAVGFGEKLSDWGVAKSPQEGNSTLDALAKVGYYLVWVMFLPGIFSTFGLTSISEPIQNMIDTALAYLPNLIGALVIVVLGFVAAGFVKNLVVNLSKSANLDGQINRLTGGSDKSQGSKDTLAQALGGLAYVLVLFPIILAALETLGIQSIARPVTQLLNSILSAIPNILVALIILAVGGFLAKIVGDLLTDLIKGSGINNYSQNIKNATGMSIDIADVIGKSVAVLIGVFFLVEALNALNLEVLNTVGSAIIAYIPNVIVAAIILAGAVIGGEYLASMINKASGSSLFGQILKYGLIILGAFMALEQLNFATAIVQQAFVLIVGASAVAFAIAFGLGGRDFAHKQLEKADRKLDEESTKGRANRDQNNPY